MSPLQEIKVQSHVGNKLPADTEQRKASLLYEKADMYFTCLTVNCMFYDRVLTHLSSLDLY